MSGHQSKNIKDKGRGHKGNKKGWALSVPRLPDPIVSETLSKPAVLLEESLKVVELIITPIKNEDNFMRANPSTEGEGRRVKKRMYNTDSVRRKKNTALKTAEENGENESKHHLPVNQQPLYKF